MKKLVAFFTVLIFLMGLSGLAAAETILVEGTGANQALLRALAKAYVSGHPGNDIQVPDSVGSGGGIQKAIDDETNLARVARTLKQREIDAGLTYKVFCKSPIVFFVNDDVKVKNLTSSQIRDIYSGKITNWKDVGGNDAKIRVMMREDGDSSLEVLLASMSGLKDITITAYSKVNFSDGDNAKAVKDTAGSIGFGTLANAKADGLRYLTINGIEPTDAKYELVSDFALVYKEARLKGLAKDFYDFIFSKAGEKIIKDYDCMPVD